jgi:hypothetical protein
MSTEPLASTVVEVPADSPDWIDTGIEVRPGQTVTLLATGTAGPAGGPAELSFLPQLFLCYRVAPGGDFDKLPAPTVTFPVDRAGRLELVANFPGAWRNRTGDLDPAWPRAAATGGYAVTVLVWSSPTAADDGLARRAVTDTSGAARTAHRRLLAPHRGPVGWSALWRTGATEIYTEHPDASGARIRCRCTRDGGLLTRPVDHALTERTRLRWQWRVLELPSTVAEDTMLNHDYLSIAVEFDNGLDLTYLWSSTLPVDTVFRCPLPWWDRHETHQVVRSGTADLGRWLAEKRPVAADYRRAIGGPLPERVVAVWLIAVAVFQGGTGECEYRAITVGED